MATGRAFDLSALPKVPRGEVRLLWAFSWCDGPLSGLCSCRGERMWFHLCAESEDEDKEGFWRRFLLMALPPGELAAEERWHALCQGETGVPAGYGEGGEGRPRSPRKARPLGAAFYQGLDAAKLRCAHLEHEPCGWFEMT
jgi:hypothetical protein